MVNGRGLMFRRRINCVQNLTHTFISRVPIYPILELGRTYERGRASINKLVLCARWHNHQIPSLNILILSIDRRLPFPARKCQRLVHGMYFISNISANWDGHQHHLRVEARPQDFSKLSRRRGESRGHLREVDHIVCRRTGVRLVGCDRSEGI